MRKAAVIVTVIGLCMFALFYYFPLVGICLWIASIGLMLMILRNAKGHKEKNDKLYDQREKNLV